MPDPAAPGSPPELVALVEWIDQEADRFEAAWRSGTPPALGDFLGTAAGTERTHLLKELVKIDLEHRWRQGDRRAVEDYLADWPELCGPDGWLADDLIDFAHDLAQEFALPAANGPVPDPTEPLVPGPSPPAGDPPDPGNGSLPRRLGKFQLGRRVGAGAFGVVYRARDTHLGRVVALKVLRAGALASREEQLRFLGEARSAAQLRHPHIVRVLEVADADGFPCIVSEYVEGRTLADLLPAHRPTPHQAAALVAQLADALAYAHSFGVIHRDVKPANILLDAAGRPHLTDFGLARAADAVATMTADGQVLGTPAYMSPEQASGHSHVVDGRTDVYSLGVVLYELLTGTRPFPDGPTLLHQVAREEPPPPRRHDRRLPRDLETVCLKAMAKSPAQRYPGATAFADDLRRFLADEPVRARPVGRTRRLVRWCRRNPLVASLVVAVTLLLLTTAGAAVHVARSSLARERERRRESLMQHLQRVRLTRHDAGWSNEAWQLITEAAAIRPDGPLRAEAAAVLTRLDARPVRRFEDLPAVALAFDASGERLLMAGSDLSGFRRPDKPGLLWDRTRDTVAPARRHAAGPVAFRGDGTPVQLVSERGKHALLLRDLAGDETLARYALSSGPRAKAPRLEATALSADVRFVAAALVGEGPGEGTIVVWKGAKAEPLHRLGCRATVVAFARDGSLLAAGDAEGRVSVWSMAAGERRATFDGVRNAVHALAFSPDGRRLAIGGAGGTVLLWDWPTGRSEVCRGSEYDVRAVAFSPDGALLASAGRGPVHLWDTASGQEILFLFTADYAEALAFAPDGSRLAVSSVARGVEVWELTAGTGCRTLRGLASPIMHVRFSPDGRRLAALAHDWELAVWDLPAGRLRRLLDTPRGEFADNAGLAFDADGRRVAVSAGREARLWDVEGGRELGRWNLPPGLTENLAFPPAGGLLLFRVETAGGVLPPYSSAPAEQHPRVGRARDLLGPDPLRPLYEVRDCNLHVFGSRLSSDGAIVVVEGLQGKRAAPMRLLRACDGRSGRLLWELSVPGLTKASVLALDPTGRFLAQRPGDGASVAFLRDAATGRELRRVEHEVYAVSPDAAQVLSKGHQAIPGLHPGFALVRCAEDATLVILGTDPPASSNAAFSRDGTLLAWGNSDGTVTVCELERLRARLAEVGLGW